MGFLDTIKNLFHIGAPAAPAQDTRPVWQQQGYDSEDAWKLDNGLTTSTGQTDPGLALNSAGLQGNISQPKTYQSIFPGETKAAAKAPANPNATVAPAAPVLPDRSNDIRANEAALSAADTQRTSGLATIQDTLNKLIGRYADEAKTNQANYGESTDTNKNNLQRNTQTALLNAAEGRRGLFGILASLGALSGSGINLANEAVQKGANADITGANDTFSENRGALDTSINAFNAADKRRREDAATAAETSRTDLENQVLQNKQKAYSQLADDYSQEGKAADAKRYADLVASLFPDIARTSVPPAQIAYSGASYTPASLAKYVGGDTGTQVQTTPASGANPLPGLLALTPLQRKKIED